MNKKREEGSRDLGCRVGMCHSRGVFNINLNGNCQKLTVEGKLAIKFSTSAKLTEKLIHCVDFN